MTSSTSFKRFIFENISDEHYRSYLLLEQMPKFIWIVEYIAKDDYPNQVHSRFLFDATALKYAGIGMMISARVGDLFIHNGKSATLTNFQEPMYKNNLREAGYGMDEASSG